MSDHTGTVLTVDGPIDPEELGVTMTHEHLFSDLSVWMEEAGSATEKRRRKEEITMDNLWYVHRNPSNLEDNMRLDSVDQAIEEMTRYLRKGGDTIVDVSPKKGYIEDGDHEHVRGVSRQTGINVVHGTGYYIQAAHPDNLTERTVEDITDEFVRDVEEGINGSTVQAGIIGELGVSGTIHEDEEKVLRAGARAALQTGTSVTIHPNGKSNRRNGTYPSSRWGLEILDILEEEGLPPERVVMGHMDRAYIEGSGIEYQKKLADRGAFVEYDLWGSEEYFFHRNDARPSDVHRIEWVTELINDGYTENLLFSQDICRKFRTSKYGGHGYFHVIHNVQPMLRDFGVSQDELKTILEENPRRMLTIVE